MSFILKLNAQELTFQNELYKLKLEITALLSRASRIRKKGDQIIFPCPVADLLYQIQAVLQNFYSLEMPPISEDNLNLFEDTLFTFETMVHPIHQLYIQILNPDKMKHAQMENKGTESSENTLSPTTSSRSTITTTTQSSASAVTTIPKANPKSQEFLDKLTHQISCQHRKIAQRNHTNNSRRPQRKRRSTSPLQLSIISTSPTSGKTPRTVPMPCDAEHKYGCPPGIGLYEMYMRDANKHTTNQK